MHWAPLSARVKKQTYWAAADISQIISSESSANKFLLIWKLVEVKSLFPVTSCVNQDGLTVCWHSGSCAEGTLNGCKQCVTLPPPCLLSIHSTAFFALLLKGSASHQGLEVLTFSWLHPGSFQRSAGLFFSLFFFFLLTNICF